MYIICLTNDGEQDWTLDANEDEIIGTGAGFRVSHTLLVCALWLLFKKIFIRGLSSLRKDKISVKNIVSESKQYF